MCIPTRTRDAKRKTRTRSRAHTITGEVGELSVLEKKEKAKQQSHMNWILSLIEQGKEKGMKESFKEGRREAMVNLLQAHTVNPPPKVRSPQCYLDTWQRICTYKEGRMRAPLSRARALITVSCKKQGAAGRRAKPEGSTSKKS